VSTVILNARSSDSEKKRTDRKGTKYGCEMFEHHICAPCLSSPQATFYILCCCLSTYLSLSGRAIHDEKNWTAILFLFTHVCMCVQ